MSVQALTEFMAFMMNVSTYMYLWLEWTINYASLLAFLN